MIREVLMLDNPNKTRELMAVLEAAVPFEVAVMPELMEYLARQQKPVDVKPTETVSKVFYLATWAASAAAFSLKMLRAPSSSRSTHLRVPHRLPFAAAVLEYQKHRVKKLKKQGRT
jgi:hypothetical protein